jgi:predicted component of type VI protein secretion system
MESCRKKTAYAAEAEAEAIRQYFDQQVALAFSPREVYHCRFDPRHWHIGHQTRKR